jgi:hexokinase
VLQFKDNTLEVHKDRMKRLKEFCHRRELPTDVYDELVEHFEFQFRKRSQEKQVEMVPCCSWNVPGMFPRCSLNFP